MTAQTHRGRALRAPIGWPLVAAMGALLAWAPGTALACETLAQQLQLGRQLTGSTWTEQAENGRTLVRENGSLPGWVLAASVQCDRWSVAVEGSVSSGVRQYDGQTSFGTPITTTSAIGDHAGRLSVGWSLTDAVQLVLDASAQRSDRTIAGTPQAAGYPETYERSLLRAGARWSIPSPFGVWTLAGAKSLTGQQNLRLQLPGKDPATLHFGAPDQWELSIAWRKAWTRNVYVDVTYRYINTATGKSDSALITAGGLPVGAAYQPKTTWVERPIAVSVGWAF